MLPLGQAAKFETQSGGVMDISLRPAFRGSQGAVTMVEEKLGEGGINIVYKAEVFASNSSPPRPVALKLVKPDVSEATTKIVEKGYAYSRDLPASVAVQTYDVGRLSDATGKPQLYVTMELVEPLDLDAFLKTKFPKGFGDALLDPATKAEAWQTLDELQRQSQNILDALSAEGLAHGDVKPANILVDVRADGSFHIRLNDMDSLGPIGMPHEIATSSYLGPQDFTTRMSAQSTARSSSTDQFAFQSTINELVFGVPVYEDGIFVSGTPTKTQLVESVRKAQEDWKLLLAQAPPGYAKRLEWVGDLGGHVPPSAGGAAAASGSLPSAPRDRSFMPPMGSESCSILKQISRGATFSP